MSVARKTNEANATDICSMRIGVEKDLWIDRWSDYCSDWVSPILVKETRQSLKSRQFFWTFFLLLVAVVVWTLIGLTFNDASNDLTNAGPALLMGYWVVLGFPLAIVIPFGAFRSLAREFEDGTIQLVSVTTMKAWQIIAGKLGSSMLQLLIYVSVLAPCIAFTYLLRGLSIPQITVGLVVCIGGSFTLCCFALFLAGVSKSKVFGVAVSIVLLIFQIWVYFLWNVFATGLTFGELPFLADDSGVFLIVNIMSAVLSTGLLMFSAAKVLISFDADNRSTIVRCVMVLQQTLFFAFAIGLSCYFILPEQVCVLNFVTAHYWLVMGLVMVGESPDLSSRVRRSIPESRIGKSLFSLFLPGPGRGLILAITNIWFCGLFFFFLNWTGELWLPEAAADPMIIGSTSRNPIGSSNFFQHLMGVVSCCIYPSFYISLVYLFCRFLRKRKPVSGVLSFLLGVVTVGVVTGGSLLFHFNALPSRAWNRYSVDQMFNWYWTTTEIVDRGSNGVAIALCLAISIPMAAVCLWSIFIASRELLTEKSAVPERVQRDQIEQRKIERPFQGETIDDIFNELDEEE